MTTVGLQQQRLLIGGEWTGASIGTAFERTDLLMERAPQLATTMTEFTELRWMTVQQSPRHYPI